MKKTTWVITAGMVALAIGCTAASESGAPSEREPAKAEPTEIGSAKVPATEQGGRAIGVDRWSVAFTQGETRVSGLDGSGNVIGMARLAGEPDAQGTITTELYGGHLRVARDGKVVENTLDERAQSFLQAFAADAKSHRESGEVRYDACSDAQFYYAVQLAQMALICATAPVTWIGFGFCAIATASAIQAKMARDTACSPPAGGGGGGGSNSSSSGGAGGGCGSSEVNCEYACGGTYMFSYFTCTCNCGTQ